MSERKGPFWDGVEGRAPMPRAAATLGFEFIRADPEHGTIELAFRATDAFTNPSGNVLGAFIAAMLYDTIGPALLAMLGPQEFQSTLDMQVRFLRSARPGRYIGKGHIVQRTDDTAHVEAQLFDAQQTLIATASATAKVIPIEQAHSAP